MIRKLINNPSRVVSELLRGPGIGQQRDDPQCRPGRRSGVHLTA